MNTLNVKKGDTVIVLSGKDKGKKGKVLSTQPAAGSPPVCLQGDARVPQVR